MRHDWRWQLGNAITTAKDAERFFNLSGDEKAAIAGNLGLPFRLTPYLAGLIARHPVLKKAYIPRLRPPGRCPNMGELDPLGEEPFMPVAGLIHRYRNRGLILASGLCPAYCRYCTRSRRVGVETGGGFDAAIDYIASHPEIDDVLISGGDPLIMADDKIDALLGKIRAIPHVSVIRIGTNVLTTMPSRITAPLVKALRKYRPLWLSIHFAHPAVLTAECRLALDRLSRAGIPMLSQTVLLKDINDDPETMRELMQGLVANNVKPYYLHHCDNIKGADFFKVDQETGKKIIAYLKETASGFAVPEYCLDQSGAKSKVRIL